MTKPAVAQAVPKTAIPTARQTPPAQAPSTQNSITITNSKVEAANKTSSQHNNMNGSQFNSDVGGKAIQKQASNEQKVKHVVDAGKHSKEVSSNNKQNSKPNVEAPTVKKILTAAEVVAATIITPPTITEPVKLIDATKPGAALPSKLKEDDKKPTPVTPQHTTETSTTTTSETNAKPTPPPVSVAKMPTVVANNTDNKINVLPDCPVVAEVKPPVVVLAEASKAATEVPVVAEQTGEQNIVKLDCWTPENKDAKKRYDREFLVSLKEKKLSKAFPDALNNFELAVLDQNAPAKSAPGMNEQFAGRSSYQGRSSFGGSSMDRGGDQGYANKGSMRREYSNKGQKKSNKDSFHANQPPVVINLQSHEIVLKKTETPYVIKSNLSDEDMLYRDTRAILNKLTPENLQKLTGTLINLPISDETRLKGCIDIIFEKAIDEQSFSQTYGQLCKVLSTIKVPLLADATKNINFRATLLTKCQKEFHSDYTVDCGYNILIEDANKEETEEKRKELTDLANYKLGKAKRRSLGNIRFIGELFKLQMLTESIMYDCIERLLKQDSDEENIECLCRLLTTIGKELDKPTNAPKMKSYFDRLEKIAKKKDSSTARIRFMLLDIIDLRKMLWVPRRKDTGPKRIDEIRAEAEEERLKIEAQIEQTRQNERNQRNQPGQRGSGTRGSGGYGGKSSMDNEGYNRAQKNPNPVNMVKKITEVRSITQRTNNSDVLLGPGGGGSSGFSWNKPKDAQAATESATPAITSSSSFGGAGGGFNKYGSEDQYGRGSSNFGQRNFGGGSKHSSEMTPRLSMDSNKGWGKSNSQVQNVKKMDGGYSNVNNRSGNSSRASSREGSTTGLAANSRENSRTRTSDNKSDTKTKSYTPDEIDRKVTVVIAEYIENGDLSEAMKDFDEFKPSKESQVVDFLELALTQNLEKTEKVRQAVGTLMYNAVLKQKKFQVSAFTKALKNTLECAEDMAIDVPKIATYLAQIIGQMLNKDTSVEFLAEACTPIKDKPICADFIAETLIAASKRLGHTTVADIFNKSKLKIHDFLTGVPDSVEFLKNKNIQWIIGNRERTQSASVSTESYEKKLFEIMEDQKCENDIIFDKIENEFSESDCAAKAFIRAIVTTVVRSCLDQSTAPGKDKLDSQLFKKRSSILTKFINHNEEFELESLYAVQALDHKMQHQPGFILVLFDMFFDDDIISEAIFWQWMKEPREEGHAISALSLKIFFEWLSESDVNESS